MLFKICNLMEVFTCMRQLVPIHLIFTGHQRSGCWEWTLSTGGSWPRNEGEDRHRHRPPAVYRPECHQGQSGVKQCLKYSICLPWPITKPLIISTLYVDRMFFEILLILLWYQKQTILQSVILLLKHKIMFDTHITSFFDVKFTRGYVHYVWYIICNYPKFLYPIASLLTWPFFIVAFCQNVFNFAKSNVASTLMPQMFSNFTFTSSVKVLD